MRRLIHPDLAQRLVKALLVLLTALTLSILIFIITYLLLEGLPVLGLTFFTGQAIDMGRSGGIFPFILSTVYLSAVALVIATPLAVGTAIYLTEYTRETQLTRIIRFAAECLAGVPSIILGLFGFVTFVLYLHLGWSVLSGGLTLAIMVLPTIIRTSEEAILAVPHAQREVSFSLGGTRWQTVTRVVLPGALPGIVTGVMLSLGRCIGETAAVIFTAGSSLMTPATLLDSGRTLAVHFYILAREGISAEMAYGTAAVLMIAILAINVSAYWLMHRIVRRFS
jgi:phosphate transport system permease protein